LAIAGWIGDCRLSIADCRLPIADWRLPTADCRLVDNAAQPGERGRQFPIGNPVIPQSTIQIDNPNRQSKSTFVNLQSVNLQSAVGNL
jgi:hypothetical protein